MTQFNRKTGRARKDEAPFNKFVKRRYTFKQLMAKVTKKNIHAEIKTGRAVGQEAI